MTNRTKEVFDRTASTYDRDRSLLIPGCDTFYRWAIDLIPAHAKNILDLGAGSGLLTALVRDRFPEAHIHLMDFSAPMLSLAGDRLGNDPRITYQRADYAKTALPDDLCAIVTSLSVHHLDDRGKRTVLKKAHSALKSGGVFVNAEQVAGPTPALDSRYRSIWLRQVRAAGATDEQIEASLYRQQEDRCSSVADQLNWMREAGFADADCWYKDNRFAVMAGTRA